MFPMNDQIFLRSRECLTSHSWLLVPSQVIHNINFKLLYTLHRIKLLSFGPNSGMRWRAIIVIVPRDREAMTAKNRTRKLAFVPNARCKSNRRRRIYIVIARGAGMATAIVERTTVNSPFTNKGGEDGGESRVSASERSCIDRPGTKKQARERSEPDQVPALDYVYVRFAALSSLLFLPLEGDILAYAPARARSRLWIMDNSRNSYRLAKEGNCSLGFSGEIRIKAKNICRDFGRKILTNEMAPSDRC